MKQVTITNKSNGSHKRMIAKDIDALNARLIEVSLDVFDISEITDDLKPEILKLAKLGREFKVVCDQCLDYVRYWTVTSGLTTPEINQLKNDFSDLKEYLNDGQPWGAYLVLDAMTDEAYIEVRNNLLVLLEGYSNG